MNIAKEVIFENLYKLGLYQRIKLSISWGKFLMRIIYIDSKFYGTAEVEDYS